MRKIQTGIRLILLAGLGSSLFAAPVSLNEAQNVAINWMSTHTGRHFDVKKKSLAVKAVEGNQATHPYRLIELEPKGWVIVSSDDTVRPVLGYGESPMNLSSLPPALKSWMEMMDRGISQNTQVRANKKLGVPKLSKYLAQWHRLKQNPSENTHDESMKSLAAYMQVKPLLWMGYDREEDGIIWGQGETSKYPYNIKCPTDDDGQNGHALTGCVATAIGQVLLYYGKPTHGTGSHTYLVSKSSGFQHNYGYQSANFSATTYNWNIMPFNLTNASSDDEIDAVATLLYQIGVSVEMDYGNGFNDKGSFAAYHDAKNTGADAALKQYFGFSNVKYYERDDYTDDTWDKMLHNSLDNGNPILYGGIGTGGHAFVLDGYGTENYYHVNWGFDMVGNGWYTLDKMKPEGTNYDFSNHQQALLIDSEVNWDNYKNHVSNVDQSGIGGGCTYNPQNKGFDLMLILMLLMAGAYPLTRKYLRQV